jgi:hypothetical protein
MGWLEPLLSPTKLPRRVSSIPDPQRGIQRHTTLDAIRKRSSYEILSPCGNTFHWMYLHPLMVTKKLENMRVFPVCDVTKSRTRAIFLLESTRENVTGSRSFSNPSARQRGHSWPLTGCSGKRSTWLLCLHGLIAASSSSVTEPSKWSTNLPTWRSCRVVSNAEFESMPD